MFNRKVWTQKWRDDNRAHVREYFHKYSIKNPEKILLLSAKNRSKKRGVECTIDETDINIPKLCPVFKEPLEKEFRPSGKKGASPYAASLDRIDSNKGYTPDNIWVVSSRANTLKNDASLQELELLVENLKALQ